MLRFLHSIEHLNDFQLEKKVQQKIQKLERKSKKYCPFDDGIGYMVSYNPDVDELNLETLNLDASFVLNCIYGQFVRPDTKMIYCLQWDLNSGVGVNNGNYYYMDDQDYLYEFCNFIKDKEIEDEYELFEYIRDFLRDYFGYLKKIGREEMNQLIMRSDGFYYDPIQEHSIHDFKGKGNAMCSEYAIMAHNLLKLFDFESYLVIGNVILDGETPMPHAYNLIKFKEQDTGKVIHAVMDFANPVAVYDIDFHKIGEVPFMGFFDSLDQDFINQFVDGEVHLDFDEYRYIILNDTVLKLGLENRKRDYYIDSFLCANSDVNCSKIYTKEKKPML